MSKTGTTRNFHQINIWCLNKCLAWSAI